MRDTSTLNSRAQKKIDQLAVKIMNHKGRHLYGHYKNSTLNELRKKSLEELQYGLAVIETLLAARDAKLANRTRVSLYQLP